MLSGSNPNNTCIPGDWMSVSTMPTFLPLHAMHAAVFATIFDFPVPPLKECTAIIFPIFTPPFIMLDMYVFVCLDPFYNHKITWIFTNLFLKRKALPKEYLSFSFSTG